MTKQASFLNSILSLAFAILIIMAIRWALYEPFVIPSGSMIPTLLINDHIIVKKYAYGIRWPFTRKWAGAGPLLPQRGDVVVFRSVEQDDYYMIKRVIGLPGDKIEYNEMGELKVNDKVSTMIVDVSHKFNQFDLNTDPGEMQIYNTDFFSKKHYTALSVNAYRQTEDVHIVPEGHLFLMGDNRDFSRDSRFWGDLPIQNLIGRATHVWLSCERTLSEVRFLCDPRYIRWQRFFHRIE